MEKFKGLRVEKWKGSHWKLLVLFHESEFGGIKLGE